MTELSYDGHLQVIFEGVTVARGEPAVRILVIEDEPRIRSFVVRALAAEGYSVDEGEDGADGLRRVLDSPYDLVVLDLLLPRVNGLEVLRRLQAERPHLPVVILSARDDLATKLRTFDFGARDYVAKPFALDELLARIRVQLRKHGAAGADGNLLRVGCVTLDLARRIATADGCVAELTTREFQLLHHLLQHAGEVVSRERLLAEVWGYHFDPHSNVVDVCIRRLRKKLGPAARIDTVRHAGYRIAAA
jgi:DNA-binding response OmpR family regulator